MDQTKLSIALLGLGLCCVDRKDMADFHYRQTNDPGFCTTTILPSQGFAIIKTEAMMNAERKRMNTKIGWENQKCEKRKRKIIYRVAASGGPMMSEDTGIARIIIIIDAMPPQSVGKQAFIKSKTFACFATFMPFARSFREIHNTNASSKWWFPSARFITHASFLVGLRLFYAFLNNWPEKHNALCACCGLLDAKIISNRLNSAHLLIFRLGRLH